jgi:hypothetical protein
MYFEKVWDYQGYDTCIRTVNGLKKTVPGRNSPLGGMLQLLPEAITSKV